MKIEVGKTYVTRGGQTVRIICTDRKDTVIPIVGLLLGRGDGEAIECYQRSGRPFMSNGDSDRDLVKELIPVTYRWANVYSVPLTIGALHEREKDVPSSSDAISGRIKLAFDPDGNLLPDECVITATKGAGV